ncbi:MAG: hypothetical protein GC193_11180 [Cryomorphaceae bacterium]|nr:hypothetical protein [Cryomorphaceae bacterium]
MRTTLLLFLICLNVLSTAQTTPLPDPGARAMELAWMRSKEKPGVVKKNDWVEIGFKLNQEIRKHIDNYLEKRGVPKQINPFDPKDLDVTFRFYPPNGADYEDRIGFYYREYERNFTSANPDEWNHIEKPTQFQIRGRLTPQIVGDWRVEARVIAFGDTLYSNQTRFSVIESDLHGFAEVGESKRFLVRDGETYFPVGQNLPWPSCHKDFDLKCQLIKCAGGEAWCHSKIMGPYGFKVYEDEMSALAASGADYFRMLIAPWNLEIEFEELNNYYDRMHCAWETDRILDKAQELGLSIHFNLQVHYPLENPNPYGMLQWDYGDLPCYPWDEPYCYADELNLANPIDFLNSEEARRHYKNRLRYLIARYGHSTAIGVMELFSESNNIGTGPDVSDDCLILDNGKAPAYATNDLLPVAISKWQDEMTTFIKEDLNHTQHPLSVSYTGLPDYKRGDQSFYHPNVDIACWNDYTPMMTKFSRTSKIVHNFQDKRQRDKISNIDPPAIGKPMILSETGPGIAEIENCDADMRWIKAAWLTSFSGMAATPINWSNDHNAELWKHFGRIKQFVAGVPFDSELWESQIDERKDLKAEVIALSSRKGEKRAIGAVHNTTVNYYTQRKSDNSVCGNLDVLGNFLPDTYRKAETVSPQKGGGKIGLSSMGPLTKYTIEWVDPQTLKVIKTDQQSANLNGRLFLEYPNMDANGFPLVLFKVHKTRQAAFATK